MGDLRDVVVELLQLGHHAVRHMLFVMLEPAGPHQPFGQKRRGAAAVREDPADVGETHATCRVNSRCGDGARRVGAEFDHRWR